MYCSFDINPLSGLRFVSLALLMALPIVGDARAQTLTECQQLWLVRNSFFKSHGYCFKTAQAIAYFGNAGCVYQDPGDVPLSRLERDQIKQLVLRERAISCSGVVGPIVAPSGGPGPSNGPTTPSNPNPTTSVPACQMFPSLC
jgi:hypothetical protein